MYAEQLEILDFFKAIEILLDNQFIQTLTEYGVGRWEKMLDIAPKATWTLDERRFAVLLRLAESLPYTFRALERMLGELCGNDGYSLDLNGYSLGVKIALTAKNKVDEVRAMLRRVCPANLAIEVALLYNTWEHLKTKTWEHLKTKTWRDIKGEALRQYGKNGTLRP